MDKAEQIQQQKDRANVFLAKDSNFVATSDHVSWQGKVRCRYCKSSGWPFRGNDPALAKVWWGNRHGGYCKWKEYWLFNNQRYLNTNAITYGATSTNGFSGQNVTIGANGYSTFRWF